MNILSVDTSTQVLSIALKTATSYEERMVCGNFSHSEDLLAEIESLLGRAGLSLKDLDLLAVTKGPGSFTGLRVGMASLKGISSALGIPLVSVPTLLVIENAASLYQGAIISAIDAKKKRFYLRLSEKGRVIAEDRDGNAEDIISCLEGIPEVLVTGPDAEAFGEKLRAAGCKADVIIDRLAPRNLSGSLIGLALKKLEKTGPDDIGEGPVYIRRSDAEEALLQKQRGEGNA